MTNSALRHLLSKRDHLSIVPRLSAIIQNRLEERLLARSYAAIASLENQRLATLGVTNSKPDSNLSPLLGNCLWC